MPIFTIQDILDMLWNTIKITSDLNGTFAETALKLVFLPLHEFSITGLFVSCVWIYIFWKNKGLIISGLSHIFHISEQLIRIMK